MNKKELIAYAEEKGCANVEFYRYTNNKMKRIHTDYIEYIDDYVADNAEIEDFAIMNEDDYNHSIYANCGERADFAEEYDNAEATVMIAIVEAKEEEISLEEIANEVNGRVENTECGEARS